MTEPSNQTSVAAKRPSGRGTKERIDVLLVELGLAPSREKAQAMIMSGIVFAGTTRIDKRRTACGSSRGHSGPWFKSALCQPRRLETGKRACCISSDAAGLPGSGYRSLYRRFLRIALYKRVLPVLWRWMWVMDNWIGN